MVDPEPGPEADADDAPERPAPPAREEIRIVEFAAKQRSKGCSICGRSGDPYIEIEVDGVLEYTCRECYEGPRARPDAFCRSCGAALRPGDNFCGRCGAPTPVRCDGCDSEVDEEDRFCGKCGRRLGPVL